MFTDFNEALRRERELHEVLRVRAEAEHEQRMRDAVAEHAALAAAFPAKEKDEVVRFKLEQQDRQAAHDDPWNSKAAAIRVDWTERQQREERKWEATPDLERRRADQERFFASKEADERRFENERGPADRKFAQEHQERNDAKAELFHAERENVFGGDIITTIGEYQMELAERDTARAGSKAPALDGVAPARGKSHQEAWAKLINHSRARDREFARVQGLVEGRLKEAQDRGDGMGAKLERLQLQRNEAAYSEVVWADTALKEFLIHGDGPKAQEAIEERRDAALAKHAYAADIKAERALFERQEQRASYPDVDVDARRGIDWQQDPLGEVEAERREHALHANMSKEQRDEAMVRVAKRDGALETAREKYIAAGDTARADIRNAATPAERETYERKAAIADADYDFAFVSGVGQKWRDVADKERAAFGETPSYKDALERVAVADKAREAARERCVAARKTTEKAEGEHLPRNVPQSARDAAHTAQEPHKVKLTGAMKTGMRLNSSIPDQAQAGYSGKRSRYQPKTLEAETARRSALLQQQQAVNPNAASPLGAGLTKTPAQGQGQANQQKAKVNPNAASPLSAGLTPLPKPTEEQAEALGYRR